MEDDRKIEEKLEALRELYNTLNIDTKLISQRLDIQSAQNSKDLENITKSLQSINNHLGHYGEQLAVHIKRSDALEDSNMILKRQLEMAEETHLKSISVLDKRLKTLEEPRIWLGITKNWLLWLAAIAGAIATIKSLF